MSFSSNVLKEDGNGVSSLNMQSVSEHKVVAKVGNGLIIRCNHNFIVCNGVITKRNGVITLCKYVFTNSKT